MIEKRSFYKIFFWALIAFLLLFGGSKSSTYIWSKSFGKIDTETKSSALEPAKFNLIIAGSKEPLSNPSQSVTRADLCILPRVLNLKTTDKLIFSWIRLPEKYDPHEIARSSLELTIPSCSLCTIIQPTWQFPAHEKYLTLFPQQDLVDKIEMMDMSLPARLNLKISGEMNDGTPFVGLESIWIIKQKK